ncbi:hypothetical protein CI109_103470 [Kwoniella shandongensis]|uniref:Succinate dehydrogenase assembly factor 4, mitochondrial n=1 Tax=Kwoniella shandongensis TaxID=1734106 RepID=A0A5M6BXN2_9TREE|nr:uncharacterized protein CI109_004627 [Kwoniella shandongensis]KAA5527091.1 hypothetical protein CI109_004627 [Kwoniella shandongensis]
MLSRFPLRAATTLPRPTLARTFITLPPLLNRSNFSKPGPPPLPPSEQAEFDRLLKANQTVGASPAIVEEPELHKDVRRGPKPEFQGEINPKTGERGGPKNDPFIAGDNDWQYGGRVTDF